MYCAYVTRIHNLRKHTNADRLLCGECFGNTVIVDLGTDPDQLGVYFPTDGTVPVSINQHANEVLQKATVEILKRSFLKEIQGGE